MSSEISTLVPSGSCDCRLSFRISSVWTFSDAIGGLGDIRSIGSGNIGATNVLRTGRKDLAALTFLLDSGKAGLAFLLVSLWLGREPGLLARRVCAGRALLSFVAEVQGRKGVATYAGLLLTAYFWKVALFGAVVWIGMAALFRMSSLAALTAAALIPIFAWAIGQPVFGVLVLLALTVLVYYRHRENIGRILSGTESRIGQKSAPPAP